MNVRSELIKVGPIPMGQRKTAKIAARVGGQVRVAYLPGDPSKAILAGNTGLKNEWGRVGGRGVRGSCCARLGAKQAIPSPGGAP